MTNSTWKAAPFSLPPEWRLMALCSVYEPSEAEQKQIRTLIGSRPDWDRLYRLLLKHRVWPTVYRNLKNADCAETDGRFMVSLEALYRRNQIKSLQYYTEMLRLMRLFREQGIQTLTVKGQVLSRLIYDDISMRVSKDLDLLISAQSLLKAERILRKEGYIAINKPGSPTDRQQAYLMKTQHHFEYVSKARGLSVELHWRIDSTVTRLGFEKFWETRTEQILDGETICVPDAETNMLYLISHGSKHAYFRLKWLCDIQEIIKRRDLDWDGIRRQARALGIEHMLALTLILSHQFYHTPLDGEWFSARVLRRANRIARLAARLMLMDGNGTESAGFSARVLNRRYLLALNMAPAEKLAVLKRSFYPNERDFAQCGLRDRYFTLYFVLRPLLVLIRTIQSKKRRKSEA